MLLSRMRLESSPLFAPGAAPQATPRRAAARYVGRHWRGELSLPVSFGINLALVGTALPLLLQILLQWHHDDGSRSLQAASALLLASAALGLLVQGWAGVGTLRSAMRRRGRDGRPAAAILAILLTTLCLSAVAVLAARAAADGQARELFALASGRDPMPPAQTQVAADGASILLLGPLGSGSGERFAAALAGAPDARLVHLSSPGGRLFEARRIAAEVRRRGLDTYVDGECASACTVVLMAGRDRGATPNARIGFHRSRFGGAWSGADPLIGLYRADGLPRDFLARVAATPSASMWYPTRDELAAAGVVTRWSLGGETPYDLAIAGVGSEDGVRALLSSVPMWRDIERRFPGSIDRAAALMWQARKGGADDADMFATMRSVTASLLPRVLAGAPDEQLDDFVRVFLDEARAALAVSPQACGSFLDARLDQRAVLPPQVMRRDLEFTQALFAAPQASAGAPAREAFAQAMGPALRRLDAQQLAVIRAPGDYRGRPRERCEALIALYGALQTLPPQPRHVALRGMFARP